MPIMAAQDQNDVRGSTRVLASTAKRYIDHVPVDDRHIPAMNGVFRLLKLYRASRLQGYEYQRQMERGPEAVCMFPATSGHVSELTVALDHAVTDAAEERGADITIDVIQHALREYVGGTGQMDEEERRTVTLFLDSLLTHLNPAD